MKLNRENKGFSLIELIIVIAIFSVVSVAIGGFLLAAQRSYAVSANELDIQEEAQKAGMSYGKYMAMKYKRESEAICR